MKAKTYKKFNIQIEHSIQVHVVHFITYVHNIV